MPTWVGLDVDSLDGMVHGDVLKEDVSNTVCLDVWRYTTNGHAYTEVDDGVADDH